MDIETLKQALLNCWNKETCYPPVANDWSSKNPARGQCGATVLVVHDYFGGEILKAKFEDGTSHFWNLINGKEIDLTRSQFDKNKSIPTPKILSRKEVEEHRKYDSTFYAILKKRVEEFLNER